MLKYSPITTGGLLFIMGIFKTILTILFAIDSIAMVIVVLMQQGKGQGLGALAGGMSADSYWGKNKGRSKEGNLKKITRVLVIIFFALAILLNINFG